MADTYASRDARRRAAMAEALMGSAMTAPQGRMVGRYYVGEGIGSGLARIGQALLANRIGKKADEAESEYQAIQKAKRDAAMTGLITDITAPREETVQDFGNVAVTKNRKPSNQEIGAALLKYQNETGMEVPKDLVGLLAPESGLGGVANKFQFGPAVITEVDGKPAFAVPTYDPASRGVKVETAPIGGRVLNRNTGLSAQDQAALDVRTEGAKTSAKTAAELAFADQQAKAAAAKAAAEASAKAKADREQGVVQKVSDAETAIDLLGRYIKAVQLQPDSAFGRGMESALGVVNAGNKEQQDALAEAENLGAQLLAYAQKLPSASSDKDVQNYQMQVGKLSDWKATKAQRIKAAQAALESYNRIIQKYGKDWMPNQTNKQANPFD